MQQQSAAYPYGVCSVKSTSALELRQESARRTTVLSSGCSSIDDLLQGGFRSGLLTEICGEASAGKTQLCLQLLLQSQLPKDLGGLNSAACYISTEGVGSMKRLQDLAEQYATRYAYLTGSSVASITARRSAARRFLDKIFIEQVYEVDEQLHMLVWYSCACTIE